MCNKVEIWQTIQVSNAFYKDINDALKQFTSTNITYLVHEVHLIFGGGFQTVQSAEALSADLLLDALQLRQMLPLTQLKK